MDWTEINKEDIELAYEVLKKLNSKHAEEFNPENHDGGISEDSARYVARIDEACDIPVLELLKEKKLSFIPIQISAEGKVR